MSQALTTDTACMKFDYPVVEWLDHADLFARLTLEDQDGPAVLDRVFEGRFSNPQEAQYKKARLGAAMRYIDLNQDSLNEVGVAVFSKDGSGIVSARLYAALWPIFSKRSDDELDDFVSPELVKEVAQGIANLRRD